MSSNHNRVAIVGRPNVGKSTLFNILTRSRSAIIKNRPGVTRDLQFGKCEWRGQEFEVVDTGGVTDSNDLMPQLIRQKVEDALRMSDLVFVVTDAKSGVMPEDESLLRLVQKSGRPYQILVNKIDKESDIDLMLAEFYELDTQLIACSFERRQGISDALDWVLKSLPQKFMAPQEAEMTLAILGKPNVGKSSLVNRLIGENRMIVSPMAGTTVDAIDIHFEKDGKKYKIIDTAGLRKKAKRQDDIEILASFKTKDAIPRADVILLMVDVHEGPTEQDAKILREIQEAHKTVILVANKIDEAQKNIERFREKFKEQLKKAFHFYEDIPVVYTSAITGSGIKSLFEKIDDLWKKVNIRITTGELNRFFTQVIRKAPSPVYRSQNVKFYYLTQTNQTPPSFIAFANHPEGVDPSYRRFLMKQIKEEWSLEGVPVRIFAMKGQHAE